MKAHKNLKSHTFWSWKLCYILSMSNRILFWGFFRLVIIFGGGKGCFFLVGFGFFLSLGFFCNWLTNSEQIGTLWSINRKYTSRKAVVLKPPKRLPPPKMLPLQAQNISGINLTFAHHCLLANLRNMWSYKMLHRRSGISTVSQINVVRLGLDDI